jgi:hypothetical protein
MGAISATGAAIIRPGAIIDLIPTGTGVLITGPTGSTITGRPITQAAAITIRDDSTGGIAYAVITSVTATGDTGAPGTGLTAVIGTGLTAVIGTGLTAVTGATNVSCQAVSFRLLTPVLSEVKNFRYSRGLARPREFRSISSPDRECMQRNGRGVGNVEAFELSRRRQPAQQVTIFYRQPAQTLVFRAQHQREWACKVGCLECLPRTALKTNALNARLAEFHKRAGQVCNMYDGNVFHRARRRLGQRAVEGRAVAPGHDESACIKRRGRAQDRPDIVRVRHLVKYDQRFAKGCIFDNFIQ